jgi:predicted RNA-binding Zn-ribbon protein involved in translation (DUF1610 family)
MAGRWGDDDDHYVGPEDDDGYGIAFADPGGNSALRASTGTTCPRRSCGKRVGRTHDFCSHCGQELNPRKHPCPECGAKNVLTTQDKRIGYRCDACADRAERGCD